mmetsp:Transcript_9098/g.27286  ORF Transcript_9098/g.27286 Transcript_9098/m.27286 type:complete len:221 (-) Transcript_9098:1417-2079(-)
MQGQEDVLGFRMSNLLLVKGAQVLPAHERGVNDLARQEVRRRLQHGGRSVLRRQLDAHLARPLHHVRHLAGVEVALRHVGHVGLRAARPLAHGVRVLLRVILHGGRGPPVRIPLAEHRVDRAAQHLRVPRADLLLLGVLGVLRVIRHLVALLLKLRDAALQLRDRRADVRQLHDVRHRRLGQSAELGELVALHLVGWQAVPESCDDAARDRYVRQLDLDA